jgi:hypothetical protein
MKKLFSLLSVLAICSFVNAQTISVEDVVVLQGSTTGSFTISANVGDAVYTGFEFTISFPKDKGFTSINKATAAWENGVIMFGDLTEGTTDFSGFTTSEGKIVDGELGTVIFNVDPTIATGDYEVSITNFTFMDGTNYIPANNVTFTVTVTDRITLDETATVAPAAATGVNVKVKRTINANEWSTICLPFAMDATQVKAAFGDDVKLGDFTGADSQINGDDVIGITANFDNVTAIEANHPYIIKVSSPISEFLVDGVNISPEEGDAFIEYDNGKTGSRRVVYSGFYGTYHAGTVLDKFSLFLYDNKFWYSVGSTQMKAFRAYFSFLDVLTDVEDSVTAPVFISFGGETTGIQNIQRTTGDDRYYNLNGQHVENLRKGQIYIKNNKKVVVK